MYLSALKIISLALIIFHLSQAFNFPEQKDLAAYDHYRELRKELGAQQKGLHTASTDTPSSIIPPEKNWSPKKQEDTIEEEKVPSLKSPLSEVIPSSGAAIRPKSSRFFPAKQASLNDELFFAERQQERDAIRGRVQRQQSLPVSTSRSLDPAAGGGTAQPVPVAGRSFRESLLATKQFDRLRDSLSKLRGSTASVHNTSILSTTTTACTIMTAADSSSSSSSSMGISTASDPSAQPTCNSSSTSFKHSLVKIIHRWKSEQQEGEEPTGGSGQPPATASFTRKRGVTIDPINVFGGLRRDQSLDSATRRGLFHKKGAWSPKSPKFDSRDQQQQQQQSSPLLENPGLLSPIRRCCLECPDSEVSSARERRLSRSEAGSDSSSKDSSIQSDTSLDSEDSCISVIFVPHPASRGGGGGAETAEAVTRTGGGSGSGATSSSQRSTSNSSESSDSPTSKGSPMSPSNSQGLSPVKALSVKSKSLPGISITGPSPPVVATAVGHTTAAEELKQPADSLVSTAIPSISALHLSSSSSHSPSSSPTLSKIPEEETPPPEPRLTPKPKISVLARIPEHRSFELEDLPTLSTSSSLGQARRVEIAEAAPGSNNNNNSSINDGRQQQHAAPRRSSRSKYDYPIVKHHPLFAKSTKGHSGISSLLLGENIEYTRKPGRSLSYGVQSVRRSTPKLLTFEIYNPETDDLDSDTSHSSSPDSDDSIISVIADCLQKRGSISGAGGGGGGDRLGQGSNLQLNPAAAPVSHTRLPPLLETSPPSTELSSQQGEDPLPLELSPLSPPPPVANESSSLCGEEETLPLLAVQLSLEDIDRKSEERTKGLLSLLGENKTVLQSISEARRRRIGGSVEQELGGTQLRASPPVLLPRSKSCSPDRIDARSTVLRGGQQPPDSLHDEVQLGSLDSLVRLPAHVVSVVSKASNNEGSSMICCDNGSKLMEETELAEMVRTPKGCETGLFSFRFFNKHNQMCIFCLFRNLSSQHTKF